MAALLALVAHAGQAAKSDRVTITMLTNSLNEPGYAVLIPNFERVYPNISINVAYAASASMLYQLETTELAAGNAPDLLSTSPGCGTPISICTLARSGELAPMTRKPWVKWSLPLVTSLDKYGQSLFAFEPTVAPEGVFTNDRLFGELGLKVPETFSQLLDVCRKAAADGTVAVLLPGAGAATVASLIVNLAVATVYGKDKSWTSKLRAGAVTFDGTPGWQTAFQELIDMTNAGCFEPGAAGTSQTAAETSFAQGQGLMTPGLSSFKGTIDAANPQFTYSFHPFPGGSNPNQTRTFLFLSNSLSVNAHSSPQSQAAAQTFVDFFARPEQDALYAETQGALTQYAFITGQIPPFMSDYAGVFAEHRYVVNPEAGWWNAGVLLALEQDEIGLITGQSPIDSVLEAMDAAWKQGPA